MDGKKKPLEGQVEHREREGVRSAFLKYMDIRAELRVQGFSDEEIDDAFRRRLTASKKH